MKSEKLKISEIFYSIQGESSYAGYPCVFIRLAGCNLHCSYCDTEYARQSGTYMTIEDVVNEVRSYGIDLAEITGGEPLLQRGVSLLVTQLQQSGCTVLLETNGTQDISGLPAGTVCILDIKCPGSGEEGGNDWDNLERLQDSDEIKFVITGKEDYQWARDVIRRCKLENRHTVLMSPAQGLLSPADLSQWMLKDRLRARLQLQLHRIIWPQGKEGLERER